MSNLARSVSFYSFYAFLCHPKATASATAVPVVTPPAPAEPVTMGVPTATLMEAGPQTVAVRAITLSPHLQWIQILEASGLWWRRWW
jgi:hypothetical protein